MLPYLGRQRIKNRFNSIIFNDKKDIKSHYTTQQNNQLLLLLISLTGAILLKKTLAKADSILDKKTASPHQPSPRVWIIRSGVIIIFTECRNTLVFDFSPAFGLDRVSGPRDFG